MVLAHEAGHFWAARRFGVKVLQVGIGLGPRIVGRRVGGVLFTINLLPVGAFVQLENDGPEGLLSLGMLRRAVVLLAGALVNVVTGISLLIGASAWPSTEMAGDLTVREIVDGSPAAAAGFMVGDVVRAVDGVPVETTAELRDMVATTRSAPTKYSVGRRGAVTTLAVEKAQGAGRLGVGVVVENPRGKSRGWTSPHVAAGRGLALAWAVVWEPVKALLLEGGSVQIAGPVGLAEVVNVAVVSGGFRIVPLIAGALSIHLGLLNLAPVPGLDGGNWRC